MMPVSGRRLREGNKCRRYILVSLLLIFLYQAGLPTVLCCFSDAPDLITRDTLSLLLLIYAISLPAGCIVAFVSLKYVEGKVIYYFILTYAILTFIATCLALLIVVLFCLFSVDSGTENDHFAAVWTMHITIA